MGKIIKMEKQKKKSEKNMWRTQQNSVNKGSCACYWIIKKRAIMMIYVIAKNYLTMPTNQMPSFQLKVTVKAKWVQKIIFNISMASNRNTDLLQFWQLYYMKSATHHLYLTHSMIVNQVFMTNFINFTSWFGAFQFCCYQGANVHGCRPYCSMIFFNIFIVCCPDVKEQNRARKLK